MARLMLLMMCCSTSALLLTATPRAARRRVHMRSSPPVLQQLPEPSVGDGDKGLSKRVQLEDALLDDIQRFKAARESVGAGEGEEVRTPLTRQLFLGPPFAPGASLSL